MHRQRHAHKRPVDGHQWGKDQRSSILKSPDTRPIKATKIALDITRVSEIAIKNSKTGKVTAVAMIMSIFGIKSGNSRSANPGKLLNKPTNG
jgi:hypothetical protein